MITLNSTVPGLGSFGETHIASLLETLTPETPIEPNTQVTLENAVRASPSMITGVPPNMLPCLGLIVTVKRN